MRSHKIIQGGDPLEPPTGSRLGAVAAKAGKDRGDLTEHGRWRTAVSNQFRKLGQPLWLRVRLLHLPPMPNGVTGSTPGSEPGGRGSSPRWAAIDSMRSRGLLQDLVWLMTAPGISSFGDSVLGSTLVIVVSKAQHASPPSWRWEFNSPRSHSHAGDATRLTYWFQKPAPTGACGFESHPAYQTLPMRRIGILLA